MHAGQLFSEHFLVDGIRTTDAYRRLAEDKAFVRDLLNRLSDAFGRFRLQDTPGEAQTEQDLIYRVLEAVGWDRDVWEVQPRAERSDVPDMLLFPDADTKSKALSERDRRFRYGVAIVENKRWDRPLDRPTKGTRKGDIEREVPSSQILRYLSRAETLSDRRIQWGILTNGRLWRLYYQGASSRLEQFLEIDLSRLVDAPSLSDLLTERNEAICEHWLRVFALMFGRASFVERVADGRTFHLLALDEGRNWEARVARDLSNLVFRGLFPDLVRALDAADPSRPAPRTEAYLRELKEAALTLLYRLLFVLYAEDRDLLPVRDERYDNYGLSPIRNEIAERVGRHDTFAAAIGHYYGQLRGLFRAIDKGEPSLGLPPYNGGLFDRQAAPLLERVDLPDAAFAPLLDALSRHGGRRINYRDLSVQQLGSIYERLLEHEVVEKDGEVEVVADEAARKGSGSFYTHEVLVQFILERAVGPLVTERAECFRQKAQALASERRSKADRIAELSTLDPASRLLEIKVCDPAMGSGHFLVSLVDFLADRVLEQVADAPLVVPFADTEHPYESPLVERIAAIRDRILRLAADGRWKVDEAQLDDRHLVRRMILKRVVYGVDKNPMAVELAKVALWLHTFTAGAPLSFLDHHLRCGDSLLGLRLADINVWLRQRGALTIHPGILHAQNAAAGMVQVERITDSDITEIEESEKTFEGVREQTEPLAAFLSLIAAERLMGVLDAAPKEKPRESRRNKDHAARVAAWERAEALQDVLDGNLGDPIAIAQGKLSVLPQEPDEPASLFPSDRPQQAPLFAGSALDPQHRRLAQGLVDEARALAADHHFLHWELAFPNVWDNWLSPDPAGGFDAVIGNPPYVRQEQIRSLKPALRKAYKAFDGVADLYVYFYELGLRLLRPGGRLSYVVTNKWLRAGYAEELRGLLSSEGWLEAVADFGHAKKFFPGADVFPCVIVVRRPDGGDPPEEAEVCQIPRDVVRLDRVSQDVGDKAFPLPRASFTRREWQLDPPRVRDLYRKVGAAGEPLAAFVGAPPLAGLKTGLNEAYVLTAGERQSLIEDNASVADMIVPYVKGADLHRWHTKAVESWLILLKSSSDHDWPWSQSPNAEVVFATSYPRVHERLKSFEDRLLSRQDQGRYWWELRPCSYYTVMQQNVIYYKDLAYSSDFCVSVPNAFPDMTCFVLPSADPWLLAVLNSPLFWGWLWRNTIHGKDETLRLKTIYMRSVPIAEPRSDARAEATSLVGRLVEIEREALSRKRMLISWYAGQLDIASPGQILREPSALSIGQFVEVIRKARGVRKPLSAAGVQAVREEYATTVQPMQAALREAERLEWRLNDLVNEAYGLTPDEVRMMWATAPPRMPLTPDVEASDQAEDEAAA